MAVIKYDGMELTSVVSDGAQAVSKAVVIDSHDGWDSHVMRVFRVGTGGYTPRHQHDWEHVIHVIAGHGRLSIGEEVIELEEKDFAFVPANIEHQFDNPGSDEFEFICIIPERGEY